jgi:predicted Rdx family selenoprotein
VELIPSSGGRFEVVVDGAAVFEKSRVGRHARPGEIMQLIAARGAKL